MIEQMNFLNIDAKESDELKAFHLIEKDLKAIIEGWYLPETALKIEPSKDNIKLSIKLYESVICRFKLSGKTRYIEIPNNYDKFVPNDTEIKKIPSDLDFSRIPISEIKDVTKYKETLCNIMDDLILSIPKDFSCCQNYIACSDAGKCIHKDREFTKGCYYKRVLKSGRIFYGKNKTI